MDKTIDWYRLADCVWAGMTLPDACKELGYDWMTVYKAMDVNKRGYFVDISMVARVKKEYLED